MGHIRSIIHDYLKSLITLNNEPLKIHPAASPAVPSLLVCDTLLVGHWLLTSCSSVAIRNEVKCFYDDTFQFHLIVMSEILNPH